MNKMALGPGHFAIGVCLLFSIPSRADDAKLPDVATIIAKYLARDEGEHVRRVVTMTLRDRHGKVRVREALSCRKFFGPDKRTVFFFLSPASVRGTGFLTFHYGDARKPDDTWLYLPNTRKARRIYSGDRGDFFVGTDFTYEDIKRETKIAVEDFTFKLLGTEVLDGHPCFKIEATPLNPRTAKQLGYVRSVNWFDAESLMSHKSVYFSANGEVLRTILTTDIQKIDDIWTAQRVVARNEKTGHSTEFRFGEVDYEASVDDSMFTEESLLRGPRRH